MTGSIAFVFRGRIACDSFIEFARHRAARLDLALGVGACSTTAISLTVAGQPDLVDMFEMACSLGPYDCIIHDISRAESPVPLTAIH